MYLQDCSEDQSVITIDRDRADRDGNERAGRFVQEVQLMGPVIDKRRRRISLCNYWETKDNSMNRLRADLSLHCNKRRSAISCENPRQWQERVRATFYPYFDGFLSLSLNDCYERPIIFVQITNYHIRTFLNGNSVILPDKSSGFILTWAVPTIFTLSEAFFAFTSR